MAVHTEHSLSRRRAMLGGTAAALAAMAVPAAAVTGSSSAEPKWQALGDELEAAYKAQRQASAEGSKAYTATSESYPPRPFLPTIRIESDGSWTWDAETAVKWRDDDRLSPKAFAEKAERRFQKRIESAHATALMGDWAPGTAERFEQEGILLWQETWRQIQQWQAECGRIDRNHRLVEIDSEIDAANARIDQIEKHILSLPATCLAGVVLKLDLILRYSDNDLWTTSSTTKLREELATAAGLQLSA